ncbi:MAG: hypothetical protein QM752_05995 [Gammaproteobacteria bacterium]
MAIKAYNITLLRKTLFCVFSLLDALLRCCWSIQPYQQIFFLKFTPYGYRLWKAHGGW